MAMSAFSDRDRTEDSQDSTQTSPLPGQGGDPESRPTAFCYGNDALAKLNVLVWVDSGPAVRAAMTAIAAIHWHTHGATIAASASSGRLSVAGVRAPRIRGKNHFSTICQLAAPASSDVISERITDPRADCRAAHFLRVPRFVGKAANIAFIETKNIPAFSRMWFNFNAIKVIPNAWSM